MNPADLAALSRSKTIGVTMTVDNVGALARAVSELTKQQVMVGIPAEANARDPADGGDFGNAAIGYVNEFGLPSRNIPPRPHLVPGVKATQEQAVKRLRKAADLALDGNQRGVLEQLNAIGLTAVSSVRNLITAGLSPALSPRTIYNRQHRKDKPKRMGTQPLIDFGDYIRHITYVIRKVR